MEIRGNSFLENVMIAAAFSRLESRSSGNQSIKQRIIRFVDVIFSSISSAYRQHRAIMSQRVMKVHADKFAPVSMAIEKVLPNKKKKSSTSTTKNKASNSAKQAKALDKGVKKRKKARIQPKKKLVQKLPASSLKPSIQTKPSTLQQKTPSIEKNDVPHQPKKRRVEKFEEEENRVEDFPRTHTNQTDEEKVAISERESEEKMAKATEYLINNPGALAGFLFSLQAYAGEMNEEDIPDLLKGLNDPSTEVEEKDHVIEDSPVDVEEKEEIVPVNEEKKEEIVPVNEEEELAKATQYLMDNPGALAGFLFSLQAYVGEMDEEDVPDLLKGLNDVPIEETDGEGEIEKEVK